MTMRPCWLFLLCTSLAAGAGTTRFPVVERLPPAQRDEIARLLAWERTLDGKSLAEAEAALGTPDLIRPSSVNSVTGERMATHIYRVSRRSELRLTIHQRRVAAVTFILLPSVDEDGPVDADES